jgi:hypothetical protein
MRAATIVAVVALAACNLNAEAPDPPNPPVVADVRTSFPLSLTADEAVAVARDYLARMRHEIAEPELHRVAAFGHAWAVPGTDAWQIDPCIPRVQDPTTVWVLRGSGDFLNLVDFAWSRNFGQFDVGFDLACRGAAPSGTIVVDDTTGYILGVYPGEHDGLQSDGK